MKVHELLADRKAWIKGAYANDEFGGIIEADHERAVCWCLMGAVIRCYGPFLRKGDLSSTVVAKIKDRLNVNNIAPWNDKESTTYEDVIALVKELDV